MKYLAIATKVKKKEVLNDLGFSNDSYLNGMILANVPQLGKRNAICHYGLSMPNVVIEVGDNLLVEYVDIEGGLLYYTGLPDLTGHKPKEFNEKFLKAFKIEEHLKTLKDQLDDLKKKYNDLVSDYKAHTHTAGTLAAAAGGGAVTGLSGTLKASTKAVDFTKEFKEMPKDAIYTQFSAVDTVDKKINKEIKRNL